MGFVLIVGTALALLAYLATICFVLLLCLVVQRVETKRFGRNRWRHLALAAAAGLATWVATAAPVAFFAHGAQSGPEIATWFGAGPCAGALFGLFALGVFEVSSHLGRPIEPPTTELWTTTRSTRDLVALICTASAIPLAFFGFVTFAAAGMIALSLLWLLVAPLLLGATIWIAVTDDARTSGRSGRGLIALATIAAAVWLGGGAFLLPVHTVSRTYSAEASRGADRVVFRDRQRVEVPVVELSYEGHGHSDIVVAVDHGVPYAQFRRCIARLTGDDDVQVTWWQRKAIFHRSWFFGGIERRGLTAIGDCRVGEAGESRSVFVQKVPPWKPW